MLYNSYTLHYSERQIPPTEILFYRGNTDFLQLFPLTEVPAGGQLFVTDTNISRLSALSPFIASFTGATPGVPSIGIRNEPPAASILLIIEAGESYKTIETVLAIINTALSYHLQRKGIFIGIGGGVITDMTAFAASIFKRGCAVELVPTTLLAMVDASIGGKTGCDFSSYKNMIGSFYPAARIHLISSFIKTLLDTEYRSGLAETLKTALLYNKELYQLLDDQQDLVQQKDETVIEYMIEQCAHAKAAVVAEDLTETGRRMQLNLGHTFGHALETVLGLGAIPHGDAVAWGIARAAQLSAHLGICSSDYTHQTLDILARYGWSTAAIHSALADKNPQEIADELIAAMKQDKKNTSDTIRVILQRTITDTVITEVSDSDIRRVLLPEQDDV